MPIIIFICIILFLYWGNNSIVVSKFSYRLNRSYDDVQNIKILHISDFHNKKFGKVGYSLIKIIKEQTPDLIVITGDIIDRRHYNLEVALSL
ncbi:MAG: metallophosphoesterase, partial [Filifactoraceae bacterium]